MNHKNRNRVPMKRKARGSNGRSPFLRTLRNIFFCICVIVFLCAIGVLGWNYYRTWKDDSALEKQQETLKQEKTDTKTAEKTSILPEYQQLYMQNKDLIGWLSIADTVIDYPVMQTPGDEEYYLHYDFYGEENQNGCLIMDTDSCVGTGTKEADYQDGSAPSTNLIIHGHTMASGQMFGDLKLYEDPEYGREHAVICFDSLYEKREYELISVFYSQVFYEYEDVFKYYDFFEADTQEEFDDWYGNIKEMSLYDTGVKAEFGDEFITLSCCSYQVEDGRFVVVGRRR